ncbi:MAG: type II secretion system F family protein [Rhodospirillales bacterium]|nr:MAG: type II secretion system F family protein [Rhodospirillales bacterium]
MSELVEFIAQADPVVLMAVVGFIVGVPTVAWMVFVADADGRRTRERLAGLPERLGGTGLKEVKKATAQLRKADAPGANGLMDRLVRRYLPNRELLAARLMRTGRTFSVGDYVLACAGVCIVVTAIAYFVIGLSLLVAPAIGAAAGIGIPHIVVGRMGDKRVERFNAQFPDAIDLIVRALRSGIPIQEAIASVSREVGDPTGALFRQIMNEMKLGVTLEDAFWRVAESIRAQEFNFLIISMSIQRETGGNLGETLYNLGKLLRDRRQMRLKIKAFSSEARTTSIIMGSLPFVIGGVIYLMNPEYISSLFTDPRGLMMLLIAGGMMSTGIFIMKRMATFEI